MSQKTRWQRFCEDFRWYTIGPKKGKRKIFENLNWGVQDYVAIVGAVMFAVSAIAILFEWITTCEVFSPRWLCGGSGIFDITIWIGVFFILIVYPLTVRLANHEENDYTSRTPLGSKHQEKNTNS